MNQLTALQKMLLAIIAIPVGGALFAQAVAAGPMATWIEIAVSGSLWVVSIVEGVRQCRQAWIDLKRIKIEKIIQQNIPPIIPEVYA